MPELNWIGKQHVVNHAEEVPFRLLRKEPGSSEGVADSGNMIVHGDNLEALKALLESIKIRGHTCRVRDSPQHYVVQRKLSPRDLLAPCA